jgi:protein TonB
MSSLTAEDRSDLSRWILSGAFVLLVHGSIVAALVTSREPEDFGAPGTVITIDLMPVPETEQTEQSDLPPGPEQNQAEAPPEKPVEKTEEKTEQEVPPAANPEVAIAAQEPQPEQPVEPQESAPTTTAPQAPRTTNANALPNWRAHIMELLERNKRYPPEARARREQGVVQLTFSLDRQGHVSGSRVTHSSGFTALDAEALALVQRVQPLPPPPPEVPGPITLVVPIRFNIR